MAADLENAIGAESELIQSSGGVFEIERDGQLLYSKKASGRFPEEHEVLHIVNNLENGMPLQQAQEEAAKGAHKPPSFGEWLGKLLHKK